MNFLKFLKQYPLILAFVVSIAVANIWQVVQNAKKIDNSATTASQTTTSAAQTTLAAGQPVVTTTTAPTPVFQTVDDSYFDDALFIGDSVPRACPLWQPDQCGLLLQRRTYHFQSHGKSCRQPQHRRECHPGTETGTKQYGKVYIMLGLNELGTGTTESWAQAYAQVIAQVRQAQPNAVIYLESILVVAASPG